VEFGAKIEICCKNSFGEPLKGVKYTLTQSGKEGETDDEGMVNENSTIPGEIVQFNIIDE
jgi:hypothetical protein